MSFGEALQSIGDGIKDLARLNVRTYTGTISGRVEGQDAQEVMDKAFQEGKLEVVAITTMMLDGDVDQFISNNSDVKQELHDAHFNAVQAGQRSRQAAFELFSNAVRGAIDKIQGG